MENNSNTKKKRGRPKKDGYKAIANIRFTVAQWEEIKKRAKAEGLKPTVFVRKVVIDYLHYTQRFNHY